jgi:MoaA/NifB/PqqE/SkfB family radical SAM enzyme|tara:strand:- start:118 stop:1191 length:1074 start_codon:yes stop_codon:yes gene_type:complete
MKPLLSQCLIGYKFGRVNVDKDYFLCCRIPPIGNFNEDGTYKEFWNSKKYNDLRKKLKYNLEKQSAEWDNLCYECPHYVENKMLSESGEIVDDLPKTGPKTFDIEVGNPCNHRCNFCWFWSYDMLENDGQWDGWKDWAKKQLDLETYISIVDDLKELGGCEEISISGGGEPFIVKDIMKMIEHTKKLGFKVKIFTNFSRVNHDDIDNFIKWGVDRFEVNISAGTEETYCKTRKLKSKDWNLLIDNLTYLNEKRKELNFTSPIKYVVIVTKENIEEIDEIFELAIKLGCYFIDFRDLVSNGVHNGQELLPSEKQVEVFNKKFLINVKKYNLKEVTDEYYYYSKERDLGVFNESISYRR